MLTRLHSITKNQGTLALFSCQRLMQHLQEPLMRHNFIAASAAKAGIKIEVVREPNDGYWSNVWNKKGWSACYWGGRPSMTGCSSSLCKRPKWNDTAWKTTDAAVRFNELVVMGAAELDEKRRAEIYFECQQLINDDGGCIMPMYNNMVWARGKNVRHGQLAANWDTDGAKLSERWWFA